MTPLELSRPCHLLLGGGTWHAAGKPPTAKCPPLYENPDLWKMPKTGQTVQGVISAKVQDRKKLLSLFVLLYDGKNRLIDKYRAGIFSSEQTSVAFRLPPVTGVRSFNLGVHSGPECGGFYIEDATIQFGE